MLLIRIQGDFCFHRQAVFRVSREIDVAKGAIPHEDPVYC